MLGERVTLCNNAFIKVTEGSEVSYSSKSKLNVVGVSQTSSKIVDIINKNNQNSFYLCSKMRCIRPF